LCICQCCIWTWVHNSFILQPSGRLKMAGSSVWFLSYPPESVIKYGGFSWKINYINGWCSITMFGYRKVYSSSQIGLSGSYSIMYQGCCEHPKYKLANPPLWESFTCNRLEQPWQIWLNISNNYPFVNQHIYGKSQFLIGKSPINGHFQ
jgi:hypothetical protein